MNDDEPHVMRPLFFHVLFHPDYTVGPGVTPDHAIEETARGLYRRWGIAPRPEN